MILVIRQMEIFRQTWREKSRLKMEILRMIVEALRWNEIDKGFSTKRFVFTKNVTLQSLEILQFQHRRAPEERVLFKTFFSFGGVFQFDSPLGEIIKYNGFEHKSPKIEFESLFCHFTCHVRVTYFFFVLQFPHLLSGDDNTYLIRLLMNYSIIQPGAWNIISAP